MTNEEKVELIFGHIDDAYPIPTYVEDDIKIAIGQALKVIKSKEVEQ